MMANDSEDGASQTIGCAESGVVYPRIVVVHVKNPVSNLSTNESLENCQHGTSIQLVVLTWALRQACRGCSKTECDHLW